MSPNIDRDAVVGRWKSEIDSLFDGVSDEVLKLHQRQRTQVKVWLGTPGPKYHILYNCGSLICELLNGHCKKVAYGHASKNILENQPLALRKSYDLFFLIVGSPGTCAEAMELAMNEQTRERLRVFIPLEYRDGYTARRLMEEYAVPTRFFRLSEAKCFASNLPKMMVEIITTHSGVLISKRGVRSSGASVRNSLNVFGNLTLNMKSHKGDNIQAAAQANVMNRSTVISNSTVTNAFNAVRARHGEAAAETYEKIRKEIERAGNPKATECFEALSKELAEKEPKKSVLGALWNKVVQYAPSVVEVAKAGKELLEQFNG